MARVLSDGSAVVATASSMLGGRYVWATPASFRQKRISSADCSGLAGWSWYQNGGPLLPHQSAAMYARLCAPGNKHRVPVSQLQAGGLVFYAYSLGVVDHVAIYDGNGGVVEAASPSLGIRQRRITFGEPGMKAYGAQWLGGHTATSGGGTTIQGSSEQVLYNAYRQAGLSEVAADAILGSNYVETGGSFSPRTYNANEGAHGIAQWEGARWTALQNYARQQGTSPFDLQTQINFELLEAKQRGNFGGVQNYSNVQDAAVYWAQHYEGSAESNWQQRADEAQKIYAVTSAGGTLQGGADATLTSVTSIAPPYVPSSLHLPLTATQRSQMLAFIKQSNVASQDPISDNASDADLLDAYRIAYVLSAKGSPKPGWTDELTGALSWITTASNWERIGLFALGAVILIFVFIEFFGGGGTVSKVAKGVALA